jgi:hypothetical protein
LPDEAYLKLQDGCRLVLTLPGGQKSVSAELTKIYGEMAWSGECRAGLAHGWGALAKPADMASMSGFKQRAYWGRMLVTTIWPSINGGDALRSYSIDGESVMFDDVADPFSPAWNKDSIIDRNLMGPDGTRVNTTASSCFIDRRRFRGCSFNDDFTVYGIDVQSKDQDKASTSWCPDPRTPQGCEALWQEKAGSVIAGIRRVTAKLEAREGALISQLDALYGPWAMQWASQQAAEADRQARQQTAEAERIASQKQQANRAFTAKLATQNAGQLFVLADSLRTQGDEQKSRQVLLALIERFPNNALAATAAQQVGSLPSTPSTRSGGGSTPALAPVNAASGGDVIAACKQFATQLHVASQSWSGNINDISARLGRDQKALFEGPCRSHPEASGYIQTAETMIGYGGDPNGVSGVGDISVPGLPSLMEIENGSGAGRNSGATGSASADSGSGSYGDNSRVIAGDGQLANDCVSLQVVASGDSSLSGGGRVLSNGCADVVEITWCYPDEGCDVHGNSWNIGPGKSWPVSAEKEIRWGACHGADTASFEKGSYGLRVICNAPLR